MFSRCSNASKIAFAHLARLLDEQQFGMIDCQMRTEHLASLGGREIDRDNFLSRLRALTVTGEAHSDWRAANSQFIW